MKDTIHTIRRSSYRFLSGTLLSRLTGMFRDISMAYVFGTQPSIAAFMVAFRLAHLLRRLFGEGALQSAFIPEFEALRCQQEQRAFIFFRDLTLVLTFFLILLIGTCCAVLAGFLWWGDLHPDNQEIISLTLLMLPSLLFICLFGLNTSLLQCEKSYFIPSVAPAAFNGIWIATVFSLRNMPAEQAMPWLAFGVVIACLCQWLLTVPQTWKSLKNILSSSRWSTLQFISSDLRQLSKPLALGILGVAASQINNAIDSLFARYAEPEGPALLWYAIRIQQLPLALFGVTIAGAVLPPLSRALKAHQWEDYHHFLHDALYRSWIFILPLTAALFVMGDTAIHFLYGRGDFGPQAIIQTTYCLWAYGIGLIPSALVLILAPACYAQNNYILPAIASFITMLLNLFLNTLFIMGFQWGAVSVALATSISAWANLGILVLYFSNSWVFGCVKTPWLRDRERRSIKSIQCLSRSLNHGSFHANQKPTNLKNRILEWKLFRNGTSLFSWPLLQQAMPMNLASIGAFWGTYEIRILFQQMPFFSDTLLFSSSFSTQFAILACQALVFGSLLTMCYLIFCLISPSLPIKT
jgi:putative peptidoglycan lipid II flippase